MDDRFPEVGHRANEVGVPLVGNLGECPRAVLTAVLAFKFLLAQVSFG